MSRVSPMPRCSPARSLRGRVQTAQDSVSSRIDVAVRDGRIIDIHHDWAAGVFAPRDAEAQEIRVQGQVIPHAGTAHVEYLLAIDPHPGSAGTVGAFVPQLKLVPYAVAKGHVGASTGDVD